MKYADYNVQLRRPIWRQYGKGPVVAAAIDTLVEQTFNLDLNGPVDVGEQRDVPTNVLSVYAGFLPVGRSWNPLDPLNTDTVEVRVDLLLQPFRPDPNPAVAADEHACVVTIGSSSNYALGNGLGAGANINFPIGPASIRVSILQTGLAVSIPNVRAFFTAAAIPTAASLYPKAIVGQQPPNATVTGRGF